MCKIKNAWVQQRLEYQLRYSKACEKYKDNINHKNHNVIESCKGAMHEMSWVLISIFGLTSKQTEEVEKNKGLTNADLNSQEVNEILYQMSTQKHYGAED